MLLNICINLNNISKCRYVKLLNLAMMLNPRLTKLSLVTRLITSNPSADFCTSPDFCNRSPYDINQDEHTHSRHYVVMMS